jgi:UDP-3-O-[3-hydroxymyristoyl] N-acetylglucosamine deacetylase/3-hydroxyacyl-[acyl-carrier-protein] dehydratase
MPKQKTLKDSFSLSGKGLHTGLNLTVTFLPASKNHGYKIQRIDMEGQPILDAVAENVIDTKRGTILGKGDFKCSTIEHAMAAFYALGVDNVLIQVNGPEFPILDGSSEPYVKEILRIGTIEQDAEKDFYYITKKMEFKDEETGACITLLPDEEFSITSMISFDGKFLNSQFATLDNIEDFATEIAAARTFVFVREIEPLLTAGLIKGGDLNNAIVIYEKQTSQENLDKLCKLTGAEHHDAAELGYLQHKKLVWDNEPARHKLLDIIGDMALIGKPLKGRIIATKPGHTINNKFARMMRKEIRKHEIQAPKYDPNKPAIMDTNQIRQLLPHRYPMLLVDKVIEMKAKSIVAIKNITSDEPFFQGHFPGEPIVPGVLIVEAMAQAGGILVINSLKDGADYNTYFIKIDNVKFKQKVVPGDTLIFRVETLGQLRHNIGSMQGYAFIGENCVAEATFTAQVIKKQEE